MASTDISVIVPFKNLQTSLSGLIESLAEELSGLDAEIVVVDMNSADVSLLQALETIKKHHLKGCVIRSGGDGLSAALNAGIYQADGKYLGFVYPNRFYRNYIPSFFAAAEAEGADVVLSVSSRSGGQKNPEADRSSVDPEELLEDLMDSQVYFDFAAVLLKRDYLLEHHIKFYENCYYGNIEAFIYNILLHDPKIACSDVRPERDADSGFQKDAPAENINCYERIEAMLKVYETMKLQRKDHHVLAERFEYQKLPSVVISVIDILLKEGFSHSVIKKTLKQKGYNELLKISHHTSPELRKKIIRWKLLPWRYHNLKP